MRPLKSLKKDKKGIGGILLFVVFFVFIMIFGIIVAGVLAIVGIGGDAITGVATDLGAVEGTNLSNVAQNSVVPFNQVVQALPWVAGFAYACALIFLVVFAIGYKTSNNPIFLGLFVVFVLFLILVAIVISNIYEQMYSANDEIGSRLRTYTALSYMILYSPVVVSIISFIAGIFMFVGRPGEDILPQ